MTGHVRFLTRARYRIYKYSGNWYGHCPHCSEGIWAVRWRSVLDLLELHGRQHLDTIVSDAS